MQLKNLIVESRIVSVDFPGLEGFKVDIAYMSKEHLLKLRKKCVTTKFNRKTRQPEEDFNIDLFNDLFVKEAVKNWSGLKYKYLETFMVVDLSDVDLEDELEYSEENALFMIKSSNDFDTWLSEVLADLDTFRIKPEKASVQNSGKVS